MDKIVRNMQLKILDVFSKETREFALSGGTALELFYLKHRFSRDLDFFSHEYNLKEIDLLVSKFNRITDETIKLENEFVVSNKARVRFYTAEIKDTSVPLKIDFVEDVLFDKPVIRKFNKVPVYDINHIYFQKIVALVGTHLTTNEIGRETITGRREVRDIIDVYYLSKKICPLHGFMKRLSRDLQRGIVYWYRSYSRQEVKFGVLDLDIYDKEFDVKGMTGHLDNEIKKFMTEVIIE